MASIDDLTPGTQRAPFAPTAAYPKGLIRYDTQNGIDGKPTRVLRPRIFVYGALLVALIAAWTWGVTTRSPLIVEVLRDRNALYRERPDGRAAGPLFEAFKAANPRPDDQLDLLDAQDDLIVLGDFNDGPGLDEFERLFGHSGVEVVMGTTLPEQRRLYDPHAEMAWKSRLQPTTARFWNVEHARYFEALLDFIMVSPGLAAQMPRWRIWHPLNDPTSLRTPDLREALIFLDLRGDQALPGQGDLLPRHPDLPERAADQLEEAGHGFAASPPQCATPRSSRRCPA